MLIILGIMVITTCCIKRLAHDVKYITKNPLEKENIYYKHDEENILKGYSLIIGNKNTPYSDGYYFFEFNYPEDYPYEPPVVKFISNDGKMRFNPNLYTNGKVCLSILNTWQGEGWTSCFTITSILMILASILNDNPLINEPGINKNDKNIDSYNYLINYKNIEFCILKQLEIISKLETNKYPFLYNFKYFKPIMCEKFKENYDSILNNLITLENNFSKYKEINITIYNIKYCLDIDKLKKNLIKMNNLLK
tara:strand:+ start:4012 stop:4764 length:753 start_codon:yes stop_codon:yes gene_type:complete